MIGELDIQRLRKEAKDELGPRFDIKEFHAAILEHGALPLTVLDQVVERWMQDQRNGRDEAPPAS
jgi:uncharacterized protein (DUF885 family)